MDPKDMHESYPTQRIFRRPCRRCGRELCLVDNRTPLRPYLETAVCVCGWPWKGPWATRWREAVVWLLRGPREIARWRAGLSGQLRALACQAWGHRWEPDGGRSCPKDLAGFGYS